MKQKKLMIGGVCALVVLFLIFFLTGDSGITTFFQARHRIAALNRQISDSHRAIDSLENEIARLKNDTAYIEKIAREKFGMAQTNETMYKFIEEK